MFINSTGYFAPEKRIPNSYFAELYGQTEDWFLQRTGILTRSRASERETLDYMCSKAVRKALETLPYDIADVDLVVFASYTPDDTVGTTGHRIQREFGIERAKVFYVSSACSSAVNGIEIIDAFFRTGKASKALLVSGDRNSTYSDDRDPHHGHLWGDAATAFFFSKERTGDGDLEVIDVETHGLGHVGMGPDGVYLRPADEGIKMPGGKDVFNQACVHMEKAAREITARNGVDISAVDWFVSHQANMRIIAYVAKHLGIPPEKALSNIEEFGNTGCASSLLVVAQNRSRFRKGDTICLTTFGGGYSLGALLLKAV